MIVQTAKFDVVVVGASIGGCTAATLFARRGLRVALLEKAPDLSHYKKLCSHYLQPVAMEVLRKLGLAERIEAADGLRNRLEVWTEWGWIRGDDRDALNHGYNIRRQTLDPILRNLALETPGVSFFPGTSVNAIKRDQRGRICGVEAGSGSGRRAFDAPLVVAADGRNSRLAQLAGIPTHISENDRFTYFTYLRGVPFHSKANSLCWHLDPNLAYGFQNDDDTVLLGIFLPKSELKRFKADPIGGFRAFWDDVPNSPIRGEDVPIDELLGMTEMPNVRRRASLPGFALVGDAALALDPIWGTGCSFAFRAADWLVESTAESLGNPSAIDRGLARYRRLHRSQTRWHEAHIAHFSKVGPRPSLERCLFAAATRDPKIASQVLLYLDRLVGLGRLFTPANIARAAVANVRHALASRSLSGAGVHFATEGAIGT